MRRGAGKRAGRFFRAISSCWGCRLKRGQVVGGCPSFFVSWSAGAPPPATLLGFALSAPHLGSSPEVGGRQAMQGAGEFGARRASVFGDTAAILPRCGGTTAVLSRVGAPHVAGG